jgi:hypothetical protein
MWVKIQTDMRSLDILFDYLSRFHAPDVFNQYAEVNPAYDRRDGAERRRENLRRYLECFRDAAYVLVSEAPGYAGCRFSGVSFTDERFLFGDQPLPWVHAAGSFLRASRDDRPLSREMSATIVWSALGDRRDIVFWPAFPWHPMGLRGPMSNRAPRREELRTGCEVLQCFLETLFPGRALVAVGRHAHNSLAALGHGDVRYIRHPAQGGATAFRRGIAELPRQD